MTLFMRAVLLFLLLALIAGCSVPDPFVEEPQPAPAQGAQIVLNVGAPAQPTQQEEPAVAKQALAASIVHFDIVAKKYSFTPSRLEVKKGDTIEITLTSSDVEHGFRIPPFNVDEKIAHGESKTFSFVADQEGEFPFSCSVYCGSGHGDMAGLLVVMA